MARFVPEHVSQDDGAVCAWEHCWAAVGAWLASGASAGSRTPTPTYFCAQARKSPCDNGGISDMQRGLQNMSLYHRATYRPDIPKDVLRRSLLRRTGNLVALEIDMDSWPASNGDVYHSVGVICGQGDGQNKGKVKTMDPAEHEYRYRDVDGVIAAAMAYNVQHHETPGTIDALVVVPPMVK